MKNDVEFYKGEFSGIFITVYKDEDSGWEKTYWCTIDIAKHIIESVNDLREVSFFGSDETKISNFNPNKISKVKNISKENLRRTAKRIHEQEEKKLKQLADELEIKFEEIDDRNIYPKYGKKFSMNKFALLNQAMLDDLINALKKPDKRALVEDNSDLIFRKIWMRKKYKDIIFEKSNDEIFLSFNEDNRETIKSLIDEMENAYFQKFKIYYFILSSFRTQNTLMKYLIKRFEELYEFSNVTNSEYIEIYNQLKDLAQAFPTTKALNAKKYLNNLDKFYIPNFSYKNIGKIVNRISLPNSNTLLMISRKDDIDILVRLLYQHFQDINKQFSEIKFKEEIEKEIHQEMNLSEELLPKISHFRNLDY